VYVFAWEGHKIDCNISVNIRKGTMFTEILD
jgi:hypothetical protein